MTTRALLALLLLLLLLLLQLLVLLLLLLLVLAAVRPERLACLRPPCSHHRAHLARDDHGLARHRPTAGQLLLLLLRLLLAGDAAAWARALAPAWVRRVVRS